MSERQHNPALIACTSLEVPEVDSRIWLAWTSTGLARASWCDAGAGPPVWGRALAQRALPAEYAAFNAYLRGEPSDPADLPYAPCGTPFQLRVYEALRSVRRGSVRSYGGIAKDIGEPRATRAVGAANGANPLAIVVPCHRVVETGYRLGGYSAGLERKRFLLTLEGVPVVDGKVQPGQLGLI